MAIWYRPVSGSRVCTGKDSLLLIILIMLIYSFLNSVWFITFTSGLHLCDEKISSRPYVPWDSVSHEKLQGLLCFTMKCVLLIKLPHFH